MSDGFEEIAARFDPGVRQLAYRTRGLIADVYPAVVEVPWSRQNVVGYGIGPKKMSEHFCYIAFHRDHVNLGFNPGAELPDPEGLLGGPGKVLRHVRITAAEGLENDAVRRLLKAAWMHREATRPPVQGHSTPGHYGRFRLGEGQPSMPDDAFAGTRTNVIGNV